MDLAELDRELTTYVRPQTFPLAVRFLKEGEALPERVRRPAKMGIRVPVCQAVGIARRYGWTMAVSGAEHNCPFGDFALGWADRGWLLERPDWVRQTFPDPDFRLTLVRTMPVLEPNSVEHVLLAPLSRAAFEPQLVVVYGNAAQVLRLVQGYNMNGHGPVTSRSGGAGVCAEALVQPFLDQEPHYALPCHGDRSFGLTQDDELIFAAPLSIWPQVLEGLKDSHQSGLMRYPVPPYLQFEAALPPSYQELKAELTKAAPAKKS